MMKNSPISRFDNLEFRLVEPNKIAVGGDGSDCRTYINFVESKVVSAL